MNNIFSVFLVLLCGCSLKSPSRSVPSASEISHLTEPKKYFEDCRREQDPTLSRRERHIISLTRRYLETLDKKPVDAYYRVKRKADEYEVFVIYVTGYSGTQPQFTPGAHCTVILRDDGTVIRVLPGA